MSNAEANIVETFFLEEANLRGRIVRLGSVVDDILVPHNYPGPIASLTGQAAVMALLLSSMLKDDGIFTLQAQGDGPLGTLVADVMGHGNVRACARFDAERLARWEADEVPETAYMGLIGQGVLVFTIDQGGQNTERYQGMVDLNGGTMAECVQHYFTQSEQIKTSIRLALRRGEDGHWRAGAILLQKMPDESKPNANQNDSPEDEDCWNRATVLLQSCKDEELLDDSLPVNDLLFRLFHQEGVRVQPPHTVQQKCRCSAERVENVLMGMSSEDRVEMSDDKGQISAKCEFCSHEYHFDAAELEKKINNPSGTIQ